MILVWTQKKGFLGLSRSGMQNGSRSSPPEKHQAEKAGKGHFLFLGR